MEIIIIFPVRSKLRVKNHAEWFLRISLNPKFDSARCSLIAVYVLPEIIQIFPIKPCNGRACSIRDRKRSNVRIGKNGPSLTIGDFIAWHFFAEGWTANRSIKECSTVICGICRTVVELEMSNRPSGKILLRRQKLLRLKSAARYTHGINPAVECVGSSIRAAANLPPVANRQ